MFTQNTVFGAGKVYFDKFDANGDPTGYRYLGATAGFALGSESERLEHYIRETPVDEKDVDQVSRLDRKFNISVEHISAANLALFIIGAASTITEAGGAVTDEPLTVLQGRFYQLGVTTGNPAGARAITTVVVTDTVPSAPYVLGTDYNVDLTLGRLEIIEGGAIASAAAEDILVDYTKTAVSREQVASSGLAETLGSLHYVADNKVGTNFDLLVPKLNLTPSGTADLKGTENTKLDFVASALVRDDNTAALYIDGRAA